MLRHDLLPPIPDQPRALPEGPLYFVGIGGAGMSAIAQVLAESGRRVSGADPGLSDTVRARLEQVGVRVHKSHKAQQTEDAVAIVVSDAIPEHNPEVIDAVERGLPIFRRPEVLGAIVNAGRGICIAGTHGKTTTTGMVASILLAANLDPTILLGGDLPAIGGNARLGKGDIVLAESCEAYDGFLYLHPKIAVVLNVEADHLDYHGDEAHVVESFKRFARQVKPGGTLIACGEDCRAEALLSDAQVTGYVYGGLTRPAYLEAKHISLHPRPSFEIVRDHERPEVVGRVQLQIPGLHNVLNALAAAGAAAAAGVENSDIIAGLEAFTGTGRRFERIGEANDVLIIDDYAHHPTELRATLTAARSAYPERRIVAVFQPHLPSRTRDNMDAFADALNMADVVYLTDIYLAREQPLSGISSAVLAERTIAAKPGLPVCYVPDKTDLPSRLFSDTRPGDLILTLGAGDIRAAGERLLEAMKQ